MKPLKYTDKTKKDFIEKVIKNISSEVREMLSKNITKTDKKNSNQFDRNMSIQLKIDSIPAEQKKRITFTLKAYLKIMELVNSYSTEVGWYGTAMRDNDGYLVTDILVYPQTVTGITVETDKDELDEWRSKFEDDIYNNIRFHGHSHVNMDVSPSSQDKEMRNSELSYICNSKDEFFIFMIFNKKKEFEVTLYDYKDNAMYDNGDIEIFVKDMPEDVLDFVETTKSMVSKEKKAYSTYYPPSTQSYANAYAKKNASKTNGYYDAVNAEDDDDIEDILSESIDGYSYSSYYNK